MGEHQSAVLVGLGDTSGCVPALDWAAREAHTQHRELRIVRAYRWPGGVAPWETAADRSVADDLRKSAERKLQLALIHVHTDWPDVRVTGDVVDGVASDVLVERSAQAELTVLGSRHLGTLGAAVLGSVSAIVAARASGPVVVVEGPPGEPAEHPTVVVGVDGSPGTDDALAFGFDHASRHGCALSAAFCWHRDLIASAQWRPEQPAPARAERWLAEAVAGWQEKYPDVEVHRAVIREHPVAGLVAASHAQELLVVGSHAQHPRIASLLGSVCQGVLHHATCPVAVVHPRATH